MNTLKAYANSPATIWSGTITTDTEVFVGSDGYLVGYVGLSDFDFAPIGNISSVPKLNGYDVISIYCTGPTGTGFWYVTVKTHGSHPAGKPLWLYVNDVPYSLFPSGIAYTRATLTENIFAENTTINLRISI